MRCSAIILNILIFICYVWNLIFKHKKSMVLISVCFWIWKVSHFCVCVFLNPHLRTCPLVLEGEEGRETGRDMDVRDIDQLPPVCAQTGDQTLQPKYVPWSGIEPCNLSVLRTMLQPTEPPSHGRCLIFQGYNSNTFYFAFLLAIRVFVSFPKLLV